MNRPICLTRKSELGTVTPVYVNPDQITYFQDSGYDHITHVHIGGDDTILRVIESPETILGILARQRDTARADERDGIREYANGH